MDANFGFCFQKKIFKHLMYILMCKNIHMNQFIDLNKYKENVQEEKAEVCVTIFFYMCKYIFSYYINFKSILKYLFN